MEPTQDEKTMAMIMWIVSIFFAVIGPLIFVLVAKDKRFTYAHSAEALAAHLAILVISIVTCGAGTVLFLVVGIVGAIKANNGEYWAVPVTSGLARKMFNL